VFIVMELACNGDLFTLINMFGGLDETFSACVLIQLIDALVFLHSCGIIHRDVKPENVFLDTDFNVKLGDFGYATHWNSKGWKKKSVGSLAYASPEILASRKYRGPEVDAWSLGSTLYTMVTNNFAFGGSNAVARILAGIWNHDPRLSTALVSFLDCLLDPDPGTRMTLTDALEHPWLLCAVEDTGTSVLSNPSLESF